MALYRRTLCLFILVLHLISRGAEPPKPAEATPHTGRHLICALQLLHKSSTCSRTSPKCSKVYQFESFRGRRNLFLVFATSQNVKRGIQVKKSHFSFPFHAFCFCSSFDQANAPFESRLFGGHTITNTFIHVRTDSRVFMFTFGL